MTGSEGKYISIACSARGFPPPSYSWMLGSSQLAEVGSERISVTASGLLYFREVVREDEGNYTCIATNSLGSDSETFSLVVEGRSSHSHDDDDELSICMSCIYRASLC